MKIGSKDKINYSYSHYLKLLLKKLFHKLLHDQHLANSIYRNYMALMFSTINADTPACLNSE